MSGAVSARAKSMPSFRCGCKRASVRWTTYGGGGYWINPGASNKNYVFLGWLLQRQVTDALAIGGEVFHQTADVVGGHDTSGFNLGAVDDFSENHHLRCWPGADCRTRPAPTTPSDYLAYQLTF